MMQEIKVLSNFLKEIGVSKWDFYTSDSIEITEISDDDFIKVIDFIADVEEQYGFAYQKYHTSSSCVIVAV